MAVEVILGEEESLDVEKPTIEDDPETFFAKNAFRMVYQTNSFFLPQIQDLIKKGEVLNLRPEYQRRLRWTTPQKSRLIESFLLNIPVPPVLFYETTEARYEVMDGQQRLNSVRDFMEGSFALSGLPVLQPLNGLRYPKCPPRIKRALERASLAAIILLLESEPAESVSGHLSLTEIRRFIFDRLNTGGTKLNAQEIRNALNPGAFNKALIEMTRFHLFTKVFDIPPYVRTDPDDDYEDPERQKNSLYKTMGDCQLVLRYFALKNKEHIRGAMKSMLDRAMGVQISEEEGEAWKREYQERFKFLYELFDHRPFRLPSESEEESREKVSAAIYDASMVAINDCWEKRGEIEADKENVQQRMKEAMADFDKMELLTGRKNTAKAVQERIKLMHRILMPQ